jgi:hypothetical protein
MQNPFERSGTGDLQLNMHPSYPTGTYAYGTHTYGSPKGSTNFMNWGQNIAYQDNTKLQTLPDMRNPTYYNNYPSKLQASSSKINLMGSAPQDSLDAFQRDREAQAGESMEEASNKFYGGETSYMKDSYPPKQETKIQSPQNLGVSSPKNFAPSIKPSERVTTDYEEAPQVKDAQYYGMHQSSPKRTGRNDNYENTANRFYNPTYLDEDSSKKKVEREREASPEDTIKMRNPMYADFNYRKYETDASTRKARFIANKDDSLEMVKKGVTGNYLSYPSQGSAIEKSYGQFYGVVTSPSVGKSFYDQTEAVKNLNRIGGVQPRYQQSYFQ